NLIPRTNWPLLVVIGLVVVCLSCSIIGLAGLAGYNDGVRTLQHFGVATRQADIVRQYDLALTDVAAGNRELAVLRLEHIVITLQANAEQAQVLLTQVNVVTATHTVTPTVTPSPTPQNTATPTISPASATAGLSLPGAEELFTQGQAAITVRDYEAAIETLNVLQGLDPDYRKAEVEQMLYEALTTLSRRYLIETSGDRLAEGILLAEQARIIADIGDLGYEAYVAGRYLDGLNAEGMECLLSVRAWESVYNEVPQYRDVTARLANAYTACGDAWTYQTEWCPAEQYYDWSLSVANNNTVAGKLTDAREKCANATPTPTPTIEGVPEGELPPTETPVQ
ncbi:hypothetical protein ACFLYO_07260, partial [Chloroflexota bacterium]